MNFNEFVSKITGELKSLRSEMQGIKQGIDNKYRVMIRSRNLSSAVSLATDGSPSYQVQSPIGSTGPTGPSSWTEASSIVPDSVDLGPTISR